MDKLIAPSDLVEIIHTQTDIAKLGADLSAVMNLAAERAMRLTHADGAAVELAEGEDMVYRAAAGMAAATLGLRLKRRGSMSGLSVEQRTILGCEDSETDPRVDRETCRRVGLRSMLVAPLDHNGTSVGVLKMMFSQPNAFGERELKILELMTEPIAAALFHGARSVTDELFYRATHDHLTGLANRALFYDRLRHQIALGRRRRKPVGILNLDMDGLKTINDTMGHSLGDAALCEVARRISAVSRLSDTVARVGGDEFGVVLSQVDGREGVLTVAARIREQIREPYVFKGRQLPLSASIGVAIFPEDGTEIEQLLESADVQMYAMKNARSRTPE